jgi:hypothetical protein
MERRHARPSYDEGMQSRLLEDFPEGCLLVAFSELDMSLREDPYSLQVLENKHLVTVEDNASSGDLGDLALLAGHASSVCHQGRATNVSSSK